MVNRLPLELLLHIAGYLPTASLSMLSRTSHTLYDLLTSLLDIRFAAEARQTFMWALRHKDYDILSRALDLGTLSPSILPYKQKYVYVSLPVRTGALPGELGRVLVRDPEIIEILMDAWRDGSGELVILPSHFQGSGDDW